MSEKKPSLTSTDSTKSPEDGCSNSPLIVIVEDICQESIAANKLTELTTFASW